MHQHLPLGWDLSPPSIIPGIGNGRCCGPGISATAVMEHRDGGLLAQKQAVPTQHTVTVFRAQTCLTAAKVLGQSPVVGVRSGLIKVPHPPALGTWKTPVLCLQRVSESTSFLLIPYEDAGQLPTQVPSHTHLHSLPSHWSLKS